MELAAPRAGGSSCSSVILHAATLEAQVCVARPPFAPPVQKIGPSPCTSNASKPRTPCWLPRRRPLRLTTGPDSQQTECRVPKAVPTRGNYRNPIIASRFLLHCSSSPFQPFSIHPIPTKCAIRNSIDFPSLSRSRSNSILVHSRTESCAMMCAMTTTNRHKAGNKETVTHVSCNASKLRQQQGFFHG